jgi:hypothetical protein
LCWVCCAVGFCWVCCACNICSYIVAIYIH